MNISSYYLWAHYKILHMMTHKIFMNTESLTISILGFFIFILPTTIMIIDVFKNKFKGSYKIIWLLLALSFNFLVVAIYFLIGKEKTIKK